MKYQVRFFSGDYAQRQRNANAAKAVLYLEHHFNGGSASANYALCNVGTNSGKTSKAIAHAYVNRISKAFRVPRANNDFAANGVSVGGYKLRGNANLILTNMPAVLLEPLFATNPKHAEIIKSESGQEKLASAIVETIREFSPSGGLIAFSIGHKGKTGKGRNDRGVELAGGGTEADYAEIVLKLAAKMLAGS